MTRAVKKGTTDQSVIIRIVDSTTGLPETAVEHNTAGIDLWYRREGAAKVSITEVALAALTTAHTDGGIEHIGDGYYRLDLPDAAFATGANGLMVGGTVTGMVVIGIYIDLVDYDADDLADLNRAEMDSNSTKLALLLTMPDLVWDEVLEGTETGRQMMRLLRAMAAGKSQDDGKEFMSIDGLTKRIDGTLTGSNRTAVTVNVS
jgi:hypothetical protein